MRLTQMTDEYRDPQGLTKEDVRRMLPEVGDHRWERPTVDMTSGTATISEHAPQRCVVVEVNREHFWYTVQFENGLRESYKVPKYRPGSGGPAV